MEQKKKPIRALVVTNMWPTPQRPAFGRFVYDQVQALRQIENVDVDVFSFPGGSTGAYARATAQARRKFRGESFDVVHGHFGLACWPALVINAEVHAVTLHGTDLAHPRSRALTLAALRRFEIVGVASADLVRKVPGWALKRGRHPEVLPCGVALDRFQPFPRAEARAALRLKPDGRYLLFPADPARPEKRFDLASLLARTVGAELLSLGNVAPEQVPLYVNAANAVVIPSDREGFGLACLEALACDVPVLSTAHGIAPEALAGLDGCLCAPFSLSSWRLAAEAHLVAEDPLIAGRERAERYSASAMAQRVVASWKAGLDRRKPPIYSKLAG